MSGDDHFIRPDNDVEPSDQDYLALADAYEAGLRKMEASNYEEWDSVIPKHKMVITALRAYAHYGQKADDKSAEWWEALNGRLSRLDHTIDLIGSALDGASVLSAVTFASDNLSEGAKRALEKRKAAIFVAAYEFRATFKHDITALKLAVQAAPVRSPGANASEGER